MSRYQAIIHDLESREVFPKTAPALDKIAAALLDTGLLARIDPNRVILVAGTNGKGSTCATLDALLCHAGQRTGLFTSPHLMQTTERIRINGADVTEDAFIALYDALYNVAQTHRLTHFEMLTLMAVKAFVEAQLDWLIFEVGLGGLWDATNAVPHHHCIITPIAFDHMHILGGTLPAIARNKFGIVGKDANVYYAPLPSELHLLQAEVQGKTHSTWTARYDFNLQIDHDGTAQPQFFITYAGYRAELNLPGQRGAENAALALTAFEGLGFAARDHLPALRQVRWPGRMERIDLADFFCPVYLSGDHNEHGIASLLEVLSHYKWRQLHIMAGIGQHKDIDAMLNQLSQLFDTNLYLTATTFKPRPLSDYGDWLHRAAFADADFHFVLAEIASKAQQNDLILITGSLYLVGEVRAALLVRQKNAKHSA